MSKPLSHLKTETTLLLSYFTLAGINGNLMNENLQPQILREKLRKRGK